MQIYLPIAEMSVSAETILSLGAVVGFLSGVFGVGGGFLTTPFLIFMGLPPAIAVGTQASQLVASSVSGVLGYLKRGHVDIRIGGVMLSGGLLGTLIGIYIFKMLQHFGQIDLVISILYVVLLGAIGLLMLVESFLTIMRRNSSEEPAPGVHQLKIFKALPYKIRFPQSKIYVSALVPAGIGFIGGLLVSIMGIGGGFLLVPAMIYILGMPTLLVAGTSLFQMIFTTAFATIMHAVANQTVDIVLALMLIVGGVVGAQFGVRLSRRVKGLYARVILALIVLVVSLQLAGDLLIKPQDLYSIDG